MESEALEFFLRVREGYAHTHADQPQRIRRIAADGSVSEVFDRVMAAVFPALEARGFVARRN